MRKWETSEYKKTIGIKEEQLDWINQNRGKKSRAGYLDKIINSYKKHEG